jgi:hypothetical protein
VDLSVVNSIRRIILAEVPTVAFAFDTYDQEDKHINVKVNTGVLHNEFLSHRISLIPLYFTLEEIENFDQDQYKFIIAKKNTGMESVFVTTKDIEIYEGDKKLPESFREHVFPCCPITGDYILITKLRPNLYNNELGEEINIEAKASIGVAAKHARWCAVNQCSFYNAIDLKLSQSDFEDLVRGKTAEEKAVIERRFEVMDKYRHFKKNKYDS